MLRSAIFRPQNKTSDELHCICPNHTDKVSPAFHFFLGLHKHCHHLCWWWSVLDVYIYSVQGAQCFVFLSPKTRIPFWKKSIFQTLHFSTHSASTLIIGSCTHVSIYFYLKVDSILAISKRNKMLEYSKFTFLHRNNYSIIKCREKEKHFILLWTSVNQVSHFGQVNFFIVWIF